jgi:hypothetical protein
MKVSLNVNIDDKEHKNRLVSASIEIDDKLTTLNDKNYYVLLHALVAKLLAEQASEAQETLKHSLEALEKDNEAIKHNQEEIGKAIRESSLVAREVAQHIADIDVYNLKMLEHTDAMLTNFTIVTNKDITNKKTR